MAPQVKAGSVLGWKQLGAELADEQNKKRP
jgi:hypothetical protein